MTILSFHPVTHAVADCHCRTHLSGIQRRNVIDSRFHKVVPVAKTCLPGLHWQSGGNVRIAVFLVNLQWGEPGGTVSISIWLHLLVRSQYLLI